MSRHIMLGDLTSFELASNYAATTAEIHDELKAAVASGAVIVLPLAPDTDSHDLKSMMVNPRALGWWMITERNDER